MTTLADAIKQTTQTLQASSPSARLDAELLLQHVTGLSRTDLIAHAQRSLSAAEQTALNALVTRRHHGEPIAYLIGHREFWSLDLLVSSATLIPRPETELLVERALARLPSNTTATVVDLGTGSGAIALAIAHERRALHVTAIDRSADALTIAQQNATRLQLQNVEFLLGDWFAPLAGRRFNVIISNPPYIPTDDPHLATGDVRFEPRSALVAGDDGLTALRHLIATAKTHLLSSGWLLLEHGFDQAPIIRQLFAEHGYTAICSYRDFAGHERVTEGQYIA